MTDKVPIKTRIAQWIADHLPRSVVYFCGLRIMANAAEQMGDDPSGMPLIEALGRWSDQ